MNDAALVNGEGHRNPSVAIALVSLRPGPAVTMSLFNENIAPHPQATKAKPMPSAE